MVRPWIFACLLVLSGCATHREDGRCFVESRTLSQGKGIGKELKKESAEPGERDPRDPLEPLNRVIFAFNTLMDETLLRPFIGFYRVMPPCLKNRITGVMDTVETPISMVNCLLQGKIHDFLAHSARLVFNTVFGLGGLFDVAGALKIKPKRQDFGKTLQTMAFMPPGPFLIIPLLGPSSLRDAVGQSVDCAVLPVTYYKKSALAYYPASYWITQAKITSIQGDISDTFSDTYGALRNAYFMLRGDIFPEDTGETTPSSALKKSPRGQGRNPGALEEGEPDLLGTKVGTDGNREAEGDKEPDLLGDSVQEGPLEVPRDSLAKDGKGMDQGGNFPGQGKGKKGGDILEEKEDGAPDLLGP